MAQTNPNIPEIPPGEDVMEGTEAELITAPIPPTPKYSVRFLSDYAFWTDQEDKYRNLGMNFVLYNFGRKAATIARQRYENGSMSRGTFTIPIDVNRPVSKTILENISAAVLYALMYGPKKYGYKSERRGIAWLDLLRTQGVLFDVTREYTPLEFFTHLSEVGAKVREKSPKEDYERYFVKMGEPPPVVPGWLKGIVTIGLTLPVINVLESPLFDDTPVKDIIDKVKDSSQEALEKILERITDADRIINAVTQVVTNTVDNKLNKFEAEILTYLKEQTKQSSVDLSPLISLVKDDLDFARKQVTNVVGGTTQLILTEIKDGLTSLGERLWEAEKEQGKMAMEAAAATGKAFADGIMSILYVMKGST